MRFSQYIHLLIEEAQNRGIEIYQLPSMEKKECILRFQSHEEVIKGTATEHIGYTRKELLNHKALGLQYIHQKGYVIPKTYLLKDIGSAVVYLDGSPFVMKPIGLNSGKGITLNIITSDDLQKAYDKIQAINPKKKKFVLQQQVSGFEYRVLVINYDSVFLIQRDPAHVIGDGVSSIRELIAQRNHNVVNQNNHITLDSDAIHLLETQQMTPESVPQAGYRVSLSLFANAHRGAITRELSDQIPDNIRTFAKKLAQDTNAPVIGIDIITPNIQESYGHILELNLYPGFEMHWHPNEGTPSHPEKPFIDMLFPETIS